MTTLAQAMTRAAYYAAHSAIRRTGKPEAAWAPSFNSMPYVPRCAAIESYLAANRHRGPTLATRLANYKAMKEMSFQL